MNEAVSTGYSVIGALAAFIAASAYLGYLAEKRIEKSEFLQGYFLGNRGLGAWALALTATVQSGGTFMGFPSLVYAHGWIVLVWISGYMIVPLSGFTILAKRFAFLSRRTGAITVPDLFRERFANPGVGLAASLMILFFMTVMMVAQFKAGATIMKLAWPSSEPMRLTEEQADFEFNKGALQKLKDQKEPKIPAEVLTSLESALGTTASTKRELLASLQKAVPDTPLKPYAASIQAASKGSDWKYLVGLVVFTVVVVGYTLVGGFLAGVWTDLFQSIMMVIGVTILLFLAIPRAGGLEQATRTAVAFTGPEYALGPGHQFRPPGEKDKPENVFDRTVAVKNASGETVDETVRIARSERAYLPIGMAVSFFFVWVFSGVGSPAGMVRVMASENTEVIRKSIFMLSIYNCLIYIPLVCICIAGRALIPALEKTDEIIPRLAVGLTQHLPGGSLLTGLILAAPFGAVMATVSCYLLVIASGLVKDIYLRFLRPRAAESEIRYVTYTAMIGVGILAIVANIDPPKFLQALVVFSGTGGACTFVVPAIMACYWRRATAVGTISAMLSGGLTVSSLYALGTIQRLALKGPPESWKETAISILGPDRMIGLDDPTAPYFLGGVDPILWGLGVSLVVGVVVSLMTSPPPREHVDRMFGDATPSPSAG
jgi:SSS family solute:Na+ symporter/sodium/pantothenate symporter